MAKLSMITNVQQTLTLAQSFIGKTQQDVLRERALQNFKTRVLTAQETTVNHARPMVGGSKTAILITDKSLECWLYFPDGGRCKWITIYPSSPKDTEEYRNYCNNHYDSEKSAPDAWLNPNTDTCVVIFEDEELGRDVIGIMPGMNDLLAELWLQMCTEKHNATNNYVIN